jgi:hypothetical protein
METRKNNPMRDKEEIPVNPDPKIDQDFEGYPSGNTRDRIIRPKTDDDHKTADTGKKDGEKINIPPGERKSLDEQDSDGSANAFEDK